MTRLIIISFTALLSLVAFAASLSAKPALKDVAYVREGIISVGIAYEISEKCDDLNPRLLRGLNYLSNLKNHARSLGYSDAEIDAYVDDSDEKNRLERIARTRLANMGAIAGNEASYCTVGRNEMAVGSDVGRLLR